MAASLPNATSQDTWTELQAAYTARLNIYVLNAAIDYQLGKGWPPFFDDQPIVVLAPGYYSLDRLCDGVRVRSHVAGAAAQVTLDAQTAQELAA